MNVRLISKTVPEDCLDLSDVPEHLIAYCARVSNPKNQINKEFQKLLNYLINHKEWSPFDMVDLSIEMSEVPRDVSRQLLRHHSFRFQEFSQRYSEVPLRPLLCSCRVQHPTNRQASIEVPAESELEGFWSEAQAKVWSSAAYYYEKALDMGIAKEVARKLLPEGMTPTTLIMKGSVRSWIHYLDVRAGNGTQFDHVELATKIGKILAEELPIVFEEHSTITTGS